MARAFSSSSRTVGRPNGSLFSLACVHKTGEREGWEVEDGKKGK